MEFKRDKRYLLAFLITLICSIICGIVLYKPAIINIYFVDFADEYVYKVFNFKNLSLIFAHLVSGVIYLYIIFFIAYFTKIKYLTLLLVFLRGIFFGLYTAMLFGAESFGGITVAVFVFIPGTLAVFALCWAVAEFCKIINTKYVYLFPLVLALADSIFYTLLINVLFRVVIAIV